MTMQPTKKRKRLSKPLWSTGSHHRADPNDCSRLAHIWGLNETNDLRQTTGELFLRPQYAWKLPEQLSFHRTITFIHTTDVENCGQSLCFFGIFCPGNVVWWILDKWFKCFSEVTLAPLWSCQMPRGWSRDLLELDRQQPAAQGPTPLSCKQKRLKFRVPRWTYMKTHNWWKVKVVERKL